MDGGLVRADETNAVNRANLPVISRLISRLSLHTALDTRQICWLAERKRYGWIRSWAHDNGSRNGHGTGTDTDTGPASIR